MSPGSILMERCQRYKSYRVPSYNGDIFLCIFQCNLCNIKAETKHLLRFFPPLNSIFHHPIPFADWWAAVAKYMHNSENHYIIHCIEKESCQASRSREGISLSFLVSLSSHLSPFSLWKSWWGRSPVEGAIQKKTWHFESKFTLPPNIPVLLNNNQSRMKFIFTLKTKYMQVFDLRKSR